MAAEMSVADLKKYIAEQGPQDQSSASLTGVLIDFIERLEQSAQENEVSGPNAEAARLEIDAMLTELSQLDSRVSKEDYYNEEDGWDLEGLKSDLEVARSRQLAAPAPAPPAPAPAPPAPVAAAPPADEAREAEALLAKLTTLDPECSKDDYFADGEWDIDGLKEDLELAEKKAAAEGKEEDLELAEKKAAAEGKEDGAALLAKLQGFDPDVSKEDYYDEDAGVWDIGGLEDDIRIYQENVNDDSGADEAQKEGPRLLAQIQALEPKVAKEDFYEDGEWDLVGLKDDLKLYQERAAADTAKLAAQKSEAKKDDPAALMAQLQQLDPEASKEDYYDEDEDEWDLEGLMDDLSMAKDKAAKEQPAPAPAAKKEDGPEQMLAKLKGLDPEVSKEDYYDADEDEWDIEGLQDDLNLAMSKAPAAAPAAPPAAAPAPAPAPAPAAVAPAPAPAAAKTSKEPVEVKVGDYVLAKFEVDEIWYSGKVTKAAGEGSFVVKWDEPDEEHPESTVAEEFIMVLPPVRAFDAVRAVWAEDGGWYEATVLKVNDDGTYDVKYIEDESTATLKPDMVRRDVPPPRYWMKPYVPGDEPPSVGEVVEADFEGDYYGATVQKVDGDNFVVKWHDEESDPSEATVSREQIRRTTLKVDPEGIAPGTKMVGIVTNMATFGAFVDFGGIRDGLVHISAMADRRLASVEDAGVEIGSVVDVWMQECKPDGKIALVMTEAKSKQKLPGGNFISKDMNLRPFVHIPMDMWLEGKVVSIAQFGAFVEVTAPNGEVAAGLVHTSRLTTGYVEDVHDHVEIGQQVKVCVMGVDLKATRMQLSMV